MTWSRRTGETVCSWRLSASFPKQVEFDVKMTTQLPDQGGAWQCRPRWHHGWLAYSSGRARVRRLQGAKPGGAIREQLLGRKRPKKRHIIRPSRGPERGSPRLGGGTDSRTPGEGRMRRALLCQAELTWAPTSADFQPDVTLSLVLLLFIFLFLPNTTCSAQNDLPFPALRVRSEQQLQRGTSLRSNMQIAAFFLSLRVLRTTTLRS